MGSIVAWHCLLIGHQFDLEDFPFWLSEQPVRVGKTGNDFFLILPAEVVGTEYGSVRHMASQHLELLNGIGRLLHPDFRPISLADSFVGVDAEEIKVHTIVQLEGVEERSKAGTMQVQNDTIQRPDPRSGAATPYLTAAARSARARSAIAVLGKAPLTWTDLYLLLEIVEGDVGGAMYTNRWISKTQSTRFSATANSFATLGLHARHGKSITSAPSVPMTYAEARQVVLSLIEQWLRDLSANDRASPQAG